MTIFKTAYDTQACQGFVMEPILQAIRKAVIMGSVGIHPDAPFYQITASSSGEIAIPGFAHPLLYPDDGPHKPEPRLVVDMRPYGRYDMAQQNFVVRAVSDHTIASVRGRLNHLWLNEPVELLRDLSTFPLTVFVEWVAKNVGKRLGLDAREERDLSILTAVFYLSCFNDNQEMTERDQQGIGRVVSRAVRGAQANDVFAVIDKLNGCFLPSIKHFCEAAKEVTSSVRLNELNVGLLFQLLGGSWYNNGREMVAVALEHPPTWIALLLAAVTDRSYHGTGLARLVEREDTKDVKQFHLATVNLLERLNPRPMVTDGLARAGA